MTKSGYKRLIELNKYDNNKIFCDLGVEELLLAAIIGSSIDEVGICLVSTDWDKLVEEYKKIEKE